MGFPYCLHVSKVNSSLQSHLESDPPSCFQNILHCIPELATGRPLIMMFVDSPFHLGEIGSSVHLLDLSSWTPTPSPKSLDLKEPFFHNKCGVPQLGSRMVPQSGKQSFCSAGHVRVCLLCDQNLGQQLQIYLVSCVWTVRSPPWPLT